MPLTLHWRTNEAHDTRLDRDTAGRVYGRVPHRRLDLDAAMRATLLDCKHPQGWVVDEDGDTEQCPFCGAIRFTTNG